MRNRVRSPIMLSSILAIAAGTATLPGSAEAMGKRVQSFVTIKSNVVNGIITDFTASGALASARSDPQGGATEEIGCWTIDGESVTCLATDRTGASVTCIVADPDDHGNVLGFVARLGILNGDSYVSFDAVAFDPTDPGSGYICSSLRVENRSIYSPKAQ